MPHCWSGSRSWPGRWRRCGVGQGDRVVIYMPMVPEAPVAMLACARLGAVHSVVFGGFAAAELAARIADAQPKVIVSASCGIEPGRVVAYKPLLDAAIALSPHKPRGCLILQRPELACDLIPGRDQDLLAAEAAAAPHPCVPVAATDPLYILYTSGTTGKPKGIVRDNGGHAVALHNSMAHALRRRAGRCDVHRLRRRLGRRAFLHRLCAAADRRDHRALRGQAGGHAGCRRLLAGLRRAQGEGASSPRPPPSAPSSGRMPEGALLASYDLSRLDALFLAGERCDPPTAVWAAALLGKPVIDHWWQTETGWPITGNFRGLGLFPARFGSGGKPAPGYEVAALDEAGQPLPAGQTGTLAIRLPMPPGCLPTLWQADDRCREAYLEAFPGWYNTSDAGVVDAEGYVSVMSRTDDIINVAGHRLSTGAMEEVLAGHPDVAECAVVGVKDSLKGQVPLGLVVLKAGMTKAEARAGAGAGRHGARPHRAGGRLQGCPDRLPPAEDPQRQDPARRRCARSPMARITWCRRRSTTRRSWRRCRGPWRRR